MTPLKTLIILVKHPTLLPTTHPNFIHFHQMIKSTFPRKRKSFVKRLTKSMILVISLLCTLHNAKRGNLHPHPTQVAYPTPHNLNQVDYHANYCPWCIFLQKQTIALNKHFTWIQYLLIRSHPTLSLGQQPNPQSTSSAPNSPPPNSLTSMHPCTQTYIFINLTALPFRWKQVRWLSLAN